MLAIRTSTLAAVAATLLAFGCDDNGGESPKDAGSNDTTSATSFTATLMDFQSKAPKEGVDMEVLDNVTGQPLDPVAFPPFKSGPDGLVALDLPPGVQVGFKASGKDASGYFIFKDSYQFNIASDAKGEKLYAVNQLTYQAALSTAFIAEGDPTVYGHLAGTLYYVTPEGEEEFIGCAEIEVTDESGTLLEEENDDPDGKATFCGIRYFDPSRDMPTSLAISSMTHSTNSRYMVADLPEGQYTITAKWVDAPNEVLGSVTLRAYPGGLSVGNIYIHGDANPTPGDPKCVGDTTH